MFGSGDNSFDTRHFSLKTAAGEYDLEAHVVRVGADLLVAVWGGRSPHIGAVSIAQPRPSLKHPEETSATASVFCFLGHKEDELAKSVSERLAQDLNANVIVTAGIHWDDLDAVGIGKVIQNSGILISMIRDRLSPSLPENERP